MNIINALKHMDTVYRVGQMQVYFMLHVLMENITIINNNRRINSSVSHTTYVCPTLYKIWNCGYLSGKTKVSVMLSFFSWVLSS